MLFIPWHFPLHLDGSITGPSKKAEKQFQQNYPAVYNHLLGFKEILAKRNIAETGIRYEWYALQRWGANYWEDFSKQKIVWTPVNSEYRFAIIDSEYYFNNSLFMITGKSIKFICGLLNSKLFVFYLKLILSNNNYQYGSGNFFSNISVLQASKELETNISFLVEKITLMKKNEPDKDANFLEKQIDDLVFKAYKIDEKERRIIEFTEI